jgi:hypothetical protein
MEPLDLRLGPPRGPRVELAGIAFTARAVDKLRASLPGGNLHEYFPFVGVSAGWAHYTGIDLNELRDVIAAAGSETEVETWILERTAHLDKAIINAKLHRINSLKMPDDLRVVFERTYSADIRERYTNIFELLELDDVRFYTTSER